MKVIRYKGKKSFVLEDMSEPDILDEGILLKVEVCSISDWDMRAYWGNSEMPDGMIPGTQFAGTVIKVSAMTEGIQIGDRLAVGQFWACSECEMCQQGKRHSCTQLKQITVDLDGGMAEYVVMSKEQLKNGWVVKIPDNVTFNEAAVADVASEVYKCQEQFEIGPGQKLLVMGCGPTGCMHTQIARLRGVDLVIQTDHLASRLEMARPFRADCLVNSSTENLEEVVRQETEGKGVNIAVVTTTDAQVLQQIIPFMARGGTIILCSRFVQSEVPVDFDSVQRNEIAIVGTDGYEERHLQKVLQLASKRKLTLKWLVTKAVGLDEIDQAMEEIRDGKQLNVVIHP